jgi:hypothetical protein
LKKTSGVRALLLLSGATLLLAALVVAGIVVLFREDLPELTAANLAAAEARWAQSGPANYDLRVELGGARPGVFEIEVRDGVVAAAPKLNGNPVRGRHTWETWSVAGQFGTIGRELELAANPASEMQLAEDTRLVLRAKFDEALGYPKEFRRIVMGSGPEISWRVTEFKPVK